MLKASRVDFNYLRSENKGTLKHSAYFVQVRSLGEIKSDSE